MKVKLIKVFDEHSRVSISTEGPSLTTQDAKDECDINYIIESYVKRGIVPPNAGSYLDCTSVADYETACLLVAEAKSNFESLPLKFREEFKTIENYLAYLNDEKNLKDCIDRGLIDKSTVPEDKLNEIFKQISKPVVETPLPVENPVVIQDSAVDSPVSANG